MPGVLDKNSFGFNREVGKMAYLNEDMNFNFNNSAFDDFLAKLCNPDDNMDELNLLSPPSSSNSSPSHDESDILPDYETPMDLISYLDNNSDIMPGLGLPLPATLCDTTECRVDNKRPRKVSCSKDPFMGHRPDFKDNVGTDSPLGSASLLNQIRGSYLDDDSPSQQNLSSQSTSTFNAWGHTPVGDDDEPAFLCGSSTMNSSFSDHEDTLPDTPQSYSGTITGDDSDVDIETIPETPHSIEFCGYSSSDTSSDISPSLSPIPSNHKMSLLNKMSSHLNTNSTKSLIRYNDVCSSATLAENLMSGRSICGKKRKHKEKNSTKVHTTINHTTYTHTYYPTGNSVNFHDYAMSPPPSMEFETAQPTVHTSSSSKRYSKRSKQINTLDLSDKEKQNHHNQLERNRRQKLADLFLDLRDEIPHITQSSKASKVMILNQATTYIGDLQRLHRSQDDVITKELHRKEYLKKQLRLLEHNRKY